jgi:two-component system, chemotaxis family, chemotaxis protein CheY
MLKKVLVVDDSELIHNMYRLMLKKYKDCEMISAKNGKEGMERLAMENGIDLILLDVNMPIMNGIQFMENFSRDGGPKKIPVIMISTEGKEEDTLRGLSLGARGYIIKPFKSVNLHNLIDSIFKSASAAVEGEKAHGI